MDVMSAGKSSRPKPSSWCNFVLMGSTESITPVASKVASLTLSPQTSVRLHRGSSTLILTHPFISAGDSTTFDIVTSSFNPFSNTSDQYLNGSSPSLVHHPSS